MESNYEICQKCGKKIIKLVFLVSNKPVKEISVCDCPVEDIEKEEERL